MASNDTHPDGVPGDMNQWIRDVVGAGKVQAVMGKLQEEQCFDMETLKECWDEIKGTIPGVPRKLISDQLHKEAVDKIQQNFRPIVQPGLWYWAGLIAFVTIALGATIGSLKGIDFSDYGLEVGDLWEEKYWYQAWGPLIVLGGIEFSVASWIGPRIGYDMIEQRSTNTDLKEAMRSNMSNQAIVGTLLLTVVWAMLQADPPVTDGVNSYEQLFISQWYEGVLVMSIGQLIIAVMTCSFNVLYLEPLDALASLQFVGDNFSYFGEPLALMICGLFNSITATILWIFGAYGYGLGICACIVFFYCIMRTMVIYLYLGKWQNPFIDDTEKQKREAVRKSIVTAGGEIKTKLSK